MQLDGIRLVVLDADGTLRRTTVPGEPCPHAPDQWELLPGVRERLATFRPDVRFGVASNQDHVGYGCLDAEMARRLLEAALRAATDRADASLVELCPHVPEDGCGCRKPGTLMLERLMARTGAAPGATLFVGDEPCDEEAARRAGVRFARANEFFGRGTIPL